MSIGSRIKQRREELGYTQPQLAEMVGVSKGSIGNYESNISSPNEETLFKLFDVLKCDANFLYQDNIDIQNLESFSTIEIQYIKKYRSLDEHGKRIIDFVLKEEYKRCSENRKITNIKDSELAVARSSTRNFMPVPTDEQIALMDEVTPDMLGE